MRLSPFAGLGLLLASIPALAAPVVVPDFSADAFRAHVAFLADDLLEGRDTGSRGHRIAAAYVASEFEALGLKPGGEQGSWYQEVPFRSATLGGPAPKVAISGPRGTKSWTNGTGVLVRPSVAETQQDVSAPVVFVGYGIDAPAQGMNDYAGLDVRGKIVAVLAGTPARLPSELAAHFGDEKAVMAERRGAIGIVTLPTDQSDKAFPFAKRLQYIDTPSLTWIGKDGRPYQEAPKVVIGAALDVPVAEALFAGAARSYADVRAEAAKGRQPRGLALKTTLRVTRISIHQRIDSPEVAAILPGSDPKLAGEYVVLMAHLDHLGIKKDAKPGEDAIYNGALDNAAGVSTMLEVARALATSPEKPRRSVMFIANTAEEKGLLGADYFAHNPTVPIGSIVGLVDLDMPLLLYPFQDVIAFGADHATVAETVAKAAGEMGVKLSPDPMPEQGIFTRSDHYMFVRQGVPAIMLATGFANGGDKAWGGFLSGNYHSVRDDMSQPILWDQGARFAKLNYLITRDLADADARPQWYKGDYFGNLYAPGAAKADAPKGK
ncbi:M28 family metallopeptidase [Flavisphingomonas formosensis]|uniref:M28 family metallopeptidase n=1 Tax=Flavisphingomonas formosensis TaxID=861534 RepID=UPI0012F818EF|nr:M28 family metallopeptidase [Sphingomonas formosensis]